MRLAILVHKPVTCVWSLESNKHMQFISSTYKILQSSFCVSDLGLVLAEVRQGEGRLRVDEMMVDVSLGGNKHQTTADTGQKKT